MTGMTLDSRGSTDQDGGLGAWVSKFAQQEEVSGLMTYLHGYGTLGTPQNGMIEAIAAAWESNFARQRCHSPDIRDIRQERRLEAMLAQ